MGEKATVYHNPRCSKSRATLQLLDDAGIECEVIEYLKTPLTQAQLQRLTEKLQLQPAELLRRGEKRYRELELGKNPTSQQALAAMVSDPILIERPIVETDNAAAIGRPPENVMDLFDL